MMIKKLRSIMGRSTVFSFNLINRDRWVARQAAALPSGGLVLDVGAGSCPYRELFRHCQYRTQDFSELQSAQLRHGGYGRIDYVCDATAIPVDNGTFDAVLCTEMLEHVPDPQSVIRELSRILKPGGRLLLTAPLGSGIHQEPYHYYGGYTPYWYHHFLSQADFEQIGVEANGGSLKFYGQESLRFLSLSRPFKAISFFPSLLWLPFWLVLLPILGGLIPVVAHLLDRFDHEQRFTVGYHVIAYKKRTGSESTSHWHTA
jgi:SAM-dependent methyltransferase